MKLADCGNQVLQEFGGAMPDNLISFEDAVREFLNVRGLELQKLGMSVSDVTLTKQTLNPSARDEALPIGFGDDCIPAFAVATPNSGSDTWSAKVAILPMDTIDSYEGSRAIAFYGNTPKRIKYAWDVWDCDETVVVYFDPVEDMTTWTIDPATQAPEVVFPPGFLPMLFKKAALNLIRVALVKLALVNPAEYISGKGDIFTALKMFENSIAAQVAEWDFEARRFRSLGRNQQPHKRRTFDEILAADWDNTTNNNPLDWTS